MRRMNQDNLNIHILNKRKKEKIVYWFSLYWFVVFQNTSWYPKIGNKERWIITVIVLEWCTMLKRLIFAVQLKWHSESCCIRYNFIFHCLPSSELSRQVCTEWWILIHLCGKFLSPFLPFRVSRNTNTVSLYVTNWFSAYCRYYDNTKKEKRKKELRTFSFFCISFIFITINSNFLYSTGGVMINYNSKHVSPLFQGFLNDRFAEIANFVNQQSLRMREWENSGRSASLFLKLDFP